MQARLLLPEAAMPGGPGVQALYAGPGWMALTGGLPVSSPSRFPPEFQPWIALPD